MTSLPRGCTDILSDTALLTINDAFAQFAAPLIRKPERFPNGWRPTLQEIFAIRGDRQRGVALVTKRNAHNPDARGGRKDL